MQPMSPTAMKTLRENKYAITQECFVPSLVEINSVVLEFVFTPYRGHSIIKPKLFPRDIQQHALTC